MWGAVGKGLRVWGGKGFVVGRENGCRRGQEAILTVLLPHYPTTLAIRSLNSVPATSLRLTCANPMDFSSTFTLFNALQEVTVLASPIFHQVFFFLDFCGAELSWSSCHLRSHYFSMSFLSPPTLHPPTHLPRASLWDWLLYSRP